MNRHTARQCAVQALFAMEVGKAEPAKAIQHVLSEQGNVSDTDQGYVERLVYGTRDLMEEIDDTLAHYVEGWSPSRMAKVELNILRLAVYELVREQDTDFAVVVDEAVQLSKSLSNETSAKFVNGVLAKLGPHVTLHQS